ncbi:MAG: biotin transporter BioY [Clostridia bacterium]|nr:biotin transporter BioY [Clostridia bacterium]
MTRIKTRNLVMCALFAALIAVGAFIRIPVPMMDYFTLQLLFVLLAGMILGPVLGTVSAAVYVAVGLAGFPIFAAGGGFSYIFRPSFGYLLGFIAAAFITGFVCRKLHACKFRHYLTAAFSGMIVTYIIGFAYKFFILNFYMHEPTALWMVVSASLIGIDIPGDVFLSIVSAAAAVKVNRALERSGKFGKR